MHVFLQTARFEVSVPVLGGRAANSVLTSVTVHGYQLSPLRLPLPSPLLGYGGLAIKASRSLLLPIAAITSSLLPRPASRLDAALGASAVDLNMQITTGYADVIVVAGACARVCVRNAAD